VSRAHDRFPLIKDHVLLKFASQLLTADRELVHLLTQDRIRAIVDLVPDAWLDNDKTLGSASAYRSAYIEYFCRRLDAPRAFSEEAMHARTLGV
jgi:23S rRNA C2498 (ribose-2'-O)-methylase RlmM